MKQKVRMHRNDYLNDYDSQSLMEALSALICTHHHAPEGPNESLIKGIQLIGIGKRKIIPRYSLQ